MPDGEAVATIRWELYLHLLVVLVVTAWAVTAAFGFTSGVQMDHDMKAGTTSPAVLFEGDTDG